MLLGRSGMAAKGTAAVQIHQVKDHPEGREIQARRRARRMTRHRLRRIPRLTLEPRG